MQNTWMSHVQTRPGLGIMRDNLLAAIEVNPWSSKSLIQSHLEESSELMIPIYAIRYSRISKSKLIFSNFYVHKGFVLVHLEFPQGTSLPFQTSMLFPTGSRQPCQRVAEDLILAATPEGLLDRMEMDSQRIGTPFHDQIYMGHDNTVEDDPLSLLFQFQLERPLQFGEVELPKGNFRLIIIRLI